MNQEKGELNVASSMTALPYSSITINYYGGKWSFILCADMKCFKDEVFVLKRVSECQCSDCAFAFKRERY